MDTNKIKVYIQYVYRALNVCACVFVSVWVCVYVFGECVFVCFGVGKRLKISSMHNKYSYGNFEDLDWSLKEHKRFSQKSVMVFVICYIGRTDINIDQSALTIREEEAKNRYMR